MPSHRKLYCLLPVILLTGLFALLHQAGTASPTADPPPVVIQQPAIDPPATGCSSYWVPITTTLDITGSTPITAYLTLNVNNPNNSYNTGEWRPNLPQDGYYQVEAWIPAHDPIHWCSGNDIIQSDTASASYTIHHLMGVTTTIKNQQASAGQWLVLGEYPFDAGMRGYVGLSDITSEPPLTTTVSFSAMRFTYTRPGPKKLYFPQASRNYPLLLTPGVRVVQGQGFDTCIYPPLNKMQTWWNQSPYEFFNIYLGGISYPSGCTKSTANWITSAEEMGWSFIPTWVGLQAPCSGFLPEKKMNSDPIIAYQQGRSEADAAINAANALGLTANGTSGTIIYYDLEAYAILNTPQQCRDTVKSFLNGWVERLHELGNKAGVYGGGCNSFASDWWGIPHTPDDVWLAHWIFNTYNSTATVWDVRCVTNDKWLNHQRLRQYAGEVQDTWGGVDWRIDINVADGEIFTPNPVTATTQAGTNPELSLTIAMTRPDITAALPQGNTLLQASFLDEQTGWTLVTPASGEGYQILSTRDGGLSWEELASPTRSEGLQPLALDFVDSQTGWLALQVPTRSIFSMGELHATTDGGQTWVRLSLPVAGPVEFINRQIGWLVGGVMGNEVYRTQDGGQNWENVTVSTEKHGRSEQIQFYLPVFEDAQHGFLPVVVGGTRLELYDTQDGGKSWGLAEALTNLPEGVAELVFTTFQTAWAKTAVGNCTGTKGSSDFSCQMDIGWWQTNDGGKTWLPVSP